MLIEYCDKKDIYPRFGYFQVIDGQPRIRIRKDLPRAMRAFIMVHELTHLADWRRGDYACDHWTENEWEANWAAIKKHPGGAVMTIIWSLAPYRLAYYWRRLRTGGASGENNHQ